MQESRILRRDERSLSARDSRELHGEFQAISPRCARCRANFRRARGRTSRRCAFAEAEQYDDRAGCERSYRRRAGDDESGNILSGAIDPAGHAVGRCPQHTRLPGFPYSYESRGQTERRNLASKFAGRCAMKRGALLLTLFVAAFGAACSGGGSTTPPPPPPLGFSNFSLKGQYAFIMTGEAADCSFLTPNGTVFARGVGG